jgi:hypothetical protein
LRRHANLIYIVTRSNYEIDLEEKVKMEVENDIEYQSIKPKLKENQEETEKEDLRISKNGMLMYKNRLYIPEEDEIKLLKLNKLHKNAYYRHPSYQKIITMLRKEFYWPNMKGETPKYLSKCIEYQQIKFEHQNPTRLLQSLPIPEWKWEIISMDFIIGLYKSSKYNDSIMVVVDKLSKETHFILVKSTYKAINIEYIFMKENFRLHGIPKTVISSRDTKFTRKFWKVMFKGLDTQLKLDTS